MRLASPRFASLGADIARKMGSRDRGQVLSHLRNLKLHRDFLDAFVEFDCREMLKNVEEGDEFE